MSLTTTKRSSWCADARFVACNRAGAPARPDPASMRADREILERAFAMDVPIRHGDGQMCCVVEPFSRPIVV
jgi:hypothetical protein